MLSRFSAVIAKEHDQEAVLALDVVLREMGALRLWRWAGHAGSQEIEVRWYLIQFRFVTTRRETFVGLMLSGPRVLVEAIAADTLARIAVAAP